MRYIRSENLKYKRSFSRKLIFVVPIITAFVAVIFGGIRNFQAQTIYWWYTFLLPGTVAIYCSLSEKKEKSVRYHTFYTLSIDLENAWYARVLVIAWYMLLTGIILVLPAVSMKIWAPAICQISNGKLLLGSICIVVMSLWQIPILLFFNKRIGILLPLIINCMLPLAISPLSNTDLWFLIPYSWVSKSMKSIIGLDVNGTMTTVSSKDSLDLRRMASVYEQQLELCERHQQEREISILQLRDAKHNMKNNLVSILAYAENRQHEKIIGFINEIMEESGMAIAAISNSGNIVIDSLIGYWYVTAKKKEIDFKTDICIPMMLPFKGADICLILGNLLENAVEAAQKVDGKKYIEIKMKYDKNNILLSVTNSYSGKLLKTKDHRLKSTKTDTENHGVGLASVYRAVAKYCGTVIIDDSVSGQFKIRVLLYGGQE